jgi:hypothetical protein
MALLAEQLVDEWLNRNGYFTMRGIKKGINEIDLLAIKPTGKGKIEARHIEVQVSFRPISYLSALTAEQMILTGAKSKTSAKTRKLDILEVGVKNWVEKKFKSTIKSKLRDEIAKGLDWKFEFVHGELRERRELDLIKDQGIALIPFKTVISDLMSAGGWVGGAATDIAEIIGYHIKPGEPSNPAG